MTKHIGFGHLRVIVFTITLASLLIGIVMPGLAFLNPTAHAYGKAASPAPAAPAQSSTNTCSVTVTVPGTSNPWLAGMPNGSTAALGDQAPAQSPVHVTGIAITPGTNISFEATGKVHFTPDVNGGNGPDGGANGSHTPGVENGIGQVFLTWNSLVGVFLDDSQPNSSPAPATALNFHTPASRDYLTFAPGLKQPFFIGDGKTSTGTPQQITVPVGATRLFLGTMDGIGWFNNSGSFTVNINRTPCNPSSCVTTLVVPGTSNPYLAGMPEGSTDNGWDAVPANSPVLVSGIPVTGGGEFTFSATGQVHLGDGGFTPPDGNAGYHNLHNPSNGIGGYLGNGGPANALLGVFLDDAAPNTTPAPAATDLYTMAGGFDYLTNSPGLKQVFFIGDGKTSTGVTQKVIAPAGATRLFLATLDGFGWFNNVGSFTVTVNAHDCAQPCESLSSPAGGVFITGNDPDFHSVRGGNTTGARHIIQRSIAYVTHNKTNPRILLVTDLRNPGGVNSDSRLGLTSSGFPTFDVADYGSGQQGALDLHSINFSNYDVIVVASDFGGWLRQDELDILNNRRNEIIDFVNHGGGLVAFGESGQNIFSGAPPPATTTHDRYGFVPFLTSVIGHDAFQTAATVTAAGLAMGLTNADVNGNFSHNYFADAAGMDIIDVDGQGRIITLATRKHIGASGILPCDTAKPAAPVITGGLPGEGGILGPGATGIPGQVTTRVVGTANPGCTIQMTISDPTHASASNNNRTLTTIVDASGNWSIDLTLDDCDPVIDIVQICGGVSSDPNHRHIYVDGTPPVFTNGGPGDSTIFISGSGGTATLILNGSASDPNTSHCLNCGGVSYEWFLIGGGTGGGNLLLGGGGAGGTLSGGGSILTIDMPPGDYEFEVVVTDAAGNRLIKRCLHRVRRPLTVTGGLPAEGGIYGPGSAGTPGRVTRTITGTGNPGCTVNIKVSDPDHPQSVSNNSTYPVSVDAAGNWSFNLTLDDCDPFIEITQVCDGVTGGDIIRRHVYVDGTPPVFLSGGPGNGLTYTGSGGTSHITLDGSGTDTGTFVPGGGVSYQWYRYDGNGSTGVLIGGAIGGVLDIDLGAGEYGIEVVVTDAAGNILRKRCHRIVRLGLTITSGLPGDGGIYGPGDGINFGHVRRIITGTGNPGCTVNIKVSDPDHLHSVRNNSTYTTTIDVAGNWSLPLDLDDCHPIVEVFEVCDGVASPIIRQQIYVDGTPPAVGLGDGGTLVGTGGMGAIVLDAAASDVGSFVPGAFSYQWFLTDSNGGNRVSLCTGCPGVLTVNQAVGEYFFEVIVTDAAGNQTIKRCRRIVFDYATATGTFVIGDQNAAVNTQVTFWGAQWDRLNSLSGGEAPASFKGFESATSAPNPTCGATWTTEPGNSPPPPASIPAYMGVIVSSSITKSGSQISGNITRLVIIRTDAAYSSNPGHAGTGTVVMTLCQ